MRTAPGLPCQSPPSAVSRHSTRGRRAAAAPHARCPHAHAARMSRPLPPPLGTAALLRATLVLQPLPQLPMQLRGGRRRSRGSNVEGSCRRGKTTVPAVGEAATAALLAAPTSPPLRPSGRWRAAAPSPAARPCRREHPANGSHASSVSRHTSRIRRYSGSHCKFRRAQTCCWANQRACDTHKG